VAEHKDGVWPIYRGMTPDGKPVELNDNVDNLPIDKLPDPPPWRRFGLLASSTHKQEGGEVVKERKTPPSLAVELERGRKFRVNPDQVQTINAALFLRRPLLITGKPGTGKSTLAYSVARELRLGPVLVWPITTRTTFQEGLYSYDAVGRLQAVAFNKESDGGTGNIVKESTNIEDYIRLGPLGTALLPSERPRVLLIDEIDKSDIDLPNNLLTIFEEGEFRIEELIRLARSQSGHADKPNMTSRKFSIRPFDSEEPIEITNGIVRCTRFPFVVMTSNDERDFPPAFLRRCLRLQITEPDDKELEEIVKLHFSSEEYEQVVSLVNQFRAVRENGYLATDQLLNAVYLALKVGQPEGENGQALKEQLANIIWHTLEG
jgi:MoxR-like ATPase